MARDRASLTERIRAALAAESSTREVPMFGGLSFMVREKMVVAVRKEGALLVRIDPKRSRELLALPGTKPAEMGAGRVMGPGWMDVAAEMLDEEGLSFWIGVALEYNAQAGTR